jgi:Tfp pilus assembly pilus retraction ATPase PilT
MVEIMINNSAVRTAIQDAAFHDVPAIMERCRGLGMQTADLALRDLLSHHLITPEEAQQHASTGLPLTSVAARKPRS